ncbi:MAG: hypothetical protein KAY32_03960 [Candidatus Eisenbacteria sp.]|nr:hypothetical protein [Candidatus Eisenbacteria bacterium]
MTLHPQLPKRAAVALGLLDVSGRRVLTLLAGELLPDRGSYEWDGTDDVGLGLPQGVYLCRLNAGRGSVTTKLMLLK